MRRSNIRRHYRRYHFKLLKCWYSLTAIPAIATIGGVIKNHPRTVKSLAAVFVIVAVIMAVTGAFLMQAQAVNRTVTSDDLLNGSMKFGTLKLTNEGNSLSLQDGVVGSWDESTIDGVQPLQTFSHGTPSMAYGPNEKMYHLTTFNGQCYFRSFDIERQEWATLKSVPAGCSTGAKIIGDGQRYIYYVPGGSTSRFFRYDISSDTWVARRDVPAQVSEVSDGLYATHAGIGYVYFFRGGASSTFARYNTRTDSWENRSSFPATGSVQYGIAVAWDGNDTIYAISNRIGEFKQYSISADSWMNIGSVSSSNIHYNLMFADNKVYAAKLNIGGNSYRTTVDAYNPSTTEWSTLASPPTAANEYGYTPAAVYDGKRYIYLQAGAHVRPTLHRYDTQQQSWNAESILPTTDNTDWHQNMVFDGDQSIYYVGGEGEWSTDRVYKYDIPSRSVTQIGTQIATKSGWKGVYRAGEIFYMPTDGQNIFQKYNTSTNSWTQLADMPFNSSWGSSIVDGGNGSLYVSFGARTNFYRYDIAGNSWHALASMTHTPHTGGGLARMGNMIYVLTANGSGHFYRYNMTNNTWSQVTNFIPSGKIDHGAFITSDGNRYIYIGAATRTDPESKRVYRFDTTNDSWQRIADLPVSTDVGASAFYDTARDKLVVSHSRHMGKIWTWSPGTESHIKSGVWYSKTMSFAQVQSWASLESTVSGTGAVTIATRTSSDGNIWTEWQDTQGTSIQSPANRHIQLRVSLTGNGASTPTVSNIAINYTQESSPPSLPSQFAAYKKAGETSGQLISGQTYEHQHPHFTWSGASDGSNGSGVDGYYVYFGVDSNADPQVHGSYQHDESYTVTAPMTAGDVYYLRIKAKDRLGHVSGTATYFSYRYWYISPPGSVVATSDSDFSSGVNTRVSIGEGAMKLRHATNGIWGLGNGEVAPSTVYSPSSIIIDGKMYLTKGNGDTSFWRYDLTSKLWETMESTPTGFAAGSSLTYDGERYIYAFAGGATTDFYRYDTDNNVWESAGTLPAAARNGADITYLGEGRIAMLFVGVREFYIYNIQSNTYEPRTSYPSTVSQGSGMWYDGNDTIYVNLGMDQYWYSFSNNQRVIFAKYSISTDTWRELAKPPITTAYNQNNLVSDGRGGLYIVGSNTIDNTDRRQMMQRYDIASNMWEEIPDMPARAIYGTVVSDKNRYLYIVASATGNSPTIYRYDTWNKVFSPSGSSIERWQRVANDIPTNAWAWQAGSASTATYDGSKYVYAIGADESAFSRFVRFDPVSGETKHLATPYYAATGGSIVYHNGHVYYQRAGNSREFYRYDILSDQWSRMTDIPNNMYRAGASSLQSIGGSIYAFNGNGNRLYRYTPDGGNGTWLQMASAPSGILNGSMVYDANSNSIFVIAGNNTTNFYRYNVSSNTWSVMANLPAQSLLGSAMVTHDGKIYTARGSTTKEMYIYDIAGNSWQNGPDAPDNFRFGSSFVKINGTYALAFAGDNSEDLWRFVFPTDTTAYEASAAHISQPIATAGVYDYAGISAEVNVPVNTRVEFFTRTSDDGTNWNAWSLSKDTKLYDGRLSTKVTSTAKKFIQVKVVLESDDNIYTPTVSSYALSYYYDIDAPTNPSVVTALKDSNQTDELTSNIWYNASKPVFDWPQPGEAGGAADGPLGSNIAGYWVYLGTDATASPRTAGIFVTDSRYAPTLQTSGTYYLRIQTQDMTGNVSADVFAPFIYKFDNNPPTNPSMITVTPGGYTTTNNFTFDWPAAFDSHSGVSAYCYHTGATSGPFAIETCQPARSLPNISAAYRTGTNVFYLRTVDLAGNYSPSYTTVSYYYSTDPPSPPTNLRAIPPSSPQNLFAFAWDLPSLYSGDPNQLTYCYSVNVLPTEINTTCTRDRFISAFKAATRQGTNIIYMVTKDEAGNVEWTNYGSANFIANTVSPGIPLNLVIADTSDRLSGRWSLTVTWDKPTFEGNGIASYVVERSADSHTFTEVGRTSNAAYVDLDVQPGETYYYRVRAADNVDNRGGASGTVSGMPQGNFATPPKVVVQPTATPGFDQATIKWVTDRPSTSFVYYGTNPSDLQQSKGSLSLTAEHSVTITGLEPTKTYYYRIQSFDNERSYNLSDAFSQINYLKTTEAARIYNVASESTTLSSTVLSWQTSVPTKSRIEYGTSLSYGLSETIDESASATHTYKLSNLESGTTYHYRIVSTTDTGAVVRSDDYTVRTIDRPTVSNVRFSPIEDEATTGVKISWTTNVPTSSTVRYAGSGVSNEETTSQLTKEHEITLRDLASSTEYSFRVQGRDQYGNLASSDEQRWKSGFDTRAPKITGVSYSMTTTEGVGNTKAQLIVSWKTDEPSTSQVAYGKSRDGNIDSLTPLDTEPTTNHVVIVSNLNLTDIYKVQIKSRDLSGNTAQTMPTLVVTPDKESNVLDNVITLMQRLFRF
mgnify:CR=1 FL=1